jgi:beta-lactamase superfamily II metal-dependent hydrolase
MSWVMPFSVLGHMGKIYHAPTTKFSVGYTYRMSREVSTGFYLLLFVALLFGTVSVYRTIFAPPVLEVRVLEVGKGTAVFMKSPGGRTVLVDTGSDASILRALGSVLPMWQRRLDAVILTSKSSASIGGLPDVQSRYKVSQVIRSAARGDRYSLGDGTFIDILWPPKTITPLKPADSVLVLRVSYGTTSFLIQKNLPLRISSWLATADANLPPPSLVISSSTPKGEYVSDGVSVTKI